MGAHPEPFQYKVVYWGLIGIALMGAIAMVTA